MEKKIIVVDDSLTCLMYVGLLLKRPNYKVIPAGSGMELLKLDELIMGKISGLSGEGK